MEFKKEENKLEVTSEVKVLRSKSELESIKAAKENSIAILQAEIVELDAQLAECDKLGINDEVEEVTKK